MNDLAEFLLARIAEDEDWARRTVHPAFDGFFRFDPARVLAECEAKRRIVEFYAGPHGQPYVLHFLALPYADHPDYRQEWRP